MANRKVAIIASSPGLETAYKALNIATAAAALDAEVAIFFTFEGLSIIHKDSAQMLQLKPGNESMAEGFKKANVPSVRELLEMAKESGVRLIACQMTVDVMGLQKITLSMESSLEARRPFWILPLTRRLRLIFKRKGV